MQWIPRLTFGALLIAGSSLIAQAQGFAFTNGALAANNCKAASAAEQAEAIGLAQSALSRIPQPMIHVHTEGTLPHQGIRDQSIQAELDWTAARDLAVGYCISGDARYLTHADAILAAWMKTYRPNFNPIDESKLDSLFLAADILDQAMPADLSAKWQSFATKLRDGYLPQIDKHAADGDNWQSHRIKLATMAAYVTADTNAIGHAESAYTTQLGANVGSDGAVTDFAKRDALHYVVYDLEPLATAALAAHDHGENWYAIADSDGVTMATALTWLRSYATGEQTHREFGNSSVGFDYARRDAGVPGFIGDWSPADSAQLYLFASALDRQWGDLAYKLGGPTKLWQRLEMGVS